MDPDAAWRVMAQTDRKVRLRSIGFLNISSTATPLLISLSRSRAVRISSCSDCTSAPSGLSHAKDLIPSSNFPCWISHRGDSGMKNMAIIKKTGTT